MDSSVSTLCEDLDIALKSGQLRPDDVDKRFNLVWPIEKAVSGLASFPETQGYSPAATIARLLWIKTHPDQQYHKLEYVLERLANTDPIVRATAVETLGAIFNSTQPGVEKGDYLRTKALLEQQQQKESSPLLAFQLAELLGRLQKSNRTSIRASAKSISNPYIAGPPVREKTKFFGRQDVLNDIMTLLREGTGTKSIVIYGARRTGKTSLLYRIRYGDLGDEYVPVYVDMQALDGQPLGKFWRTLVRRILDVMEERQKSPNQMSSDIDQEIDFDYVERFLEKALGQINPVSLLVMFDEYEVFQNFDGINFAARQLQSLLEKEPRLFFVFTGGQKLEALKERDLLLLLDNAKYMKITFLKPEEACRLITEPARETLQFASGIIEQIQDICAGHPFYTQLLCQKLFELAHEQGMVRDQDVEQAVSQLIENPPPHLILGWNSLALDQKITASALAVLQAEPAGSACTQEVGDYLKEQRYPIRLEKEDLQRTLATLREIDWVQRIENRYRFAMDLVRRWVAEHNTIWDLLEEHRLSVLNQVASLGQRAWAFVIDVLGISVITSALSALGITTASALIYSFFALVYFLVFMTLPGVTPGMLVAHIRPLSEAGVRLRGPRSLLFATVISLPLVIFALSVYLDSFLLMLLSWTLLILHVAVIHFGKKRRGLFDKLAHVIVVRE